jgi:outer membrane protein OmpU
MNRNSEGNKMKKVLLATSALVAFGGAASADVTFSGYARFGAQYTEGKAAVAAKAGTALTAAQITALTGAADTAIGNAGTANDTLAEQIDLLNTAINGTPLTVTAGTPNAVNVPTTGLVGAVAAAEAAIALSIQNTGASTATLDTNLATAQKNLAEVQAVLASIVGTQAVAAVKDALNIDQRFRMNVNATAESDNGLSFGAMVRMQADESGDNAGVVGINAPRFSVSAGGLSVAAGNIWGAIDSMPGVYAGTVGLTGLGFSNVATNFGSQTYDSTGAGVNGVELIYSAGDLTLHVSTVKNAATEVAVAYSMNGITLGLGASDTDVATNAEWVASVGGKLGDASVTLVAAQTVAGNTSMTLSGSFAVGAATTVTGYIANDEAQADQSAYGIGVVHNLGGGTSIRGGIANIHGTNRADLGVQFNF